MMWLHNPLADMNGPLFLFFYTTVILLTVACSWRAMQQFDALESATAPPIPTRPDPYEIAYLRGGENEVTRLVIFNLVQSGYLQKFDDLKKFWQNKAAPQIRRAPNPPSVHSLSPLESVVFKWFDRPRGAAKIFKADGLSTLIAPYCRIYESRLRDGGLLTAPALQTIAWQVRVGALLLIEGLGIYKLSAALSNERTNVSFLILLIISAFPMMIYLTKVPRLNRRGRAFLGQLQLAFGRLKPSKFRSAKSTQIDTDLALMVAIFGVDTLATTKYAYYPQMFRQSAAGGGGGDFSSGGCGGGDSSGGCGGGDGGGGGCGGCGGGS